MTTNATKSEDRRKAERRISPAIGEFALQERGKLLEEIARLRAALELAARHLEMLDRGGVEWAKHSTWYSAKAVRAALSTKGAA